MNRQITKFSLIILMIGILTIAGINRSTDAATKQNMSAATYITNLQPKDKVPSKYDDIDLYIETEKEEGHIIKTLTPVTKSEPINQLISDWIQSEKQEFLESRPGDTDKKASLNISLNIKQESENYHRFIFRVQEKDEMKAKTEHEKVFNLNLETGECLSLGDFFSNHDEGVVSLLNLAFESLEQEKITVDEDSRATIRESETNLNWFVTDKGLTFVLDGQLMTPAKQSSVYSHIPLQKLYLLTNKDIHHYIELSKTQKEEIEVAIQKEKDRILAIKREEEKRQQAEEAARKKKEEAFNKDGGKYIALTFDDGPNKDVTPRVLDILKQYNAKATFFMTGIQVGAYPNIAKQVAQAGHEIGNHTERHQDLSKLNAGGVRSEIQTTSDKIVKATGVRPRLVRPPYGAYNNTVINSAANHGEAIIMWSVDSLDWQSRNAGAINRVIQQTVKSGSIVLMHDIHPTTADALPELMKTLHEQGYQFITVTELLEMQGKSGVGPFSGN